VPRLNAAQPIIFPDGTMAPHFRDFLRKLEDNYNNSFGWKDLTSSISSGKVPAANAPVFTNFGPTATPQRKEYVFTVNDYIYLEPFHVNHDIRNAEAYLHVHWSTNGTSTGNVKWEFSVLRALGHQQAAFNAVTTITVEAAHMGVAWGHNVTEVTAPADILTFTEPDELLLVTLRRVAASSNENANSVFGLTVDLHYYADRDATPNKSPNFYGS